MSPVIDHSAFIEQLDTWANTLEAAITTDVSARGLEIVAQTITQIRQVAADLHREDLLHQIEDPV